MLLGWMAHAMAQGLAVIPALTGHVIDTTATLDASQTQVLDVETHRAPIDEVIADIYRQWQR